MFIIVLYTKRVILCNLCLYVLDELRAIYLKNIVYEIAVQNNYFYVANSFEAFNLLCYPIIL